MSHIHFHIRLKIYSVDTQCFCFIFPICGDILDTLAQMGHPTPALFNVLKGRPTSAGKSTVKIKIEHSE
jgi:hypothetical protein